MTCTDTGGSRAPETLARLTQIGPVRCRARPRYPQRAPEYYQVSRNVNCQAALDIGNRRNDPIPHTLPGPHPTLHPLSDGCNGARRHGFTDAARCADSYR